MLSAGSPALYTSASELNFAADNASGVIKFSTGSSVPERARIDTSGNLLVGTTARISTGKGATIFGDTSTAGSILEIRNAANANAGRDFVRFFNNSNAEAGSIEHNATSTVAYLTSSDYRLKENVKPMVNGLNKVMQLKPCTYKWKSDGTAGEGFIAHELQDVIPIAVSGEKDAVDESGKMVIQGVDTSFVVATLVAAIQEQQETITALEARITALETKQ
jgi:hypothetical protein